MAEFMLETNYPSRAYTPMKCALQFERYVSNINRYGGKLHNKAVSNLGVFPKKIA